MLGDGSAGIKACVARMVDSMFESGVKRSVGAVVGKGKMAEDGEGDEDGDGLGIQVREIYPHSYNKHRRSHLLS